MTRVAWASVVALAALLAATAAGAGAGAGTGTGAPAAQDGASSAPSAAGANHGTGSTLPAAGPGAPGPEGATGTIGTSATTGSAGAATLRRDALGPAAAVPRGPRLFERCTREAVFRRYRGAERRHFVRRCQLGYGRRLFRNRAVATGHR